MSFRTHFQRSILAGLASLLPLVLTIVVLVVCWRFVQDRVSEPINRSIKQRLLTGTEEEVALNARGTRLLGGWFQWTDEELALRGKALRSRLDKSFPNYLGLAVGVLIIVVSLYLLGWFMASVVGRQIYERTERAITRLPIVQKIYPTAKRVTTFLFGGAGPKNKFSRVVAVEYPYRGVYAIAYVTGEGIDAISRHAGREVVNVFVPTSPVPATGYILFVPADEIIPLPITMDESVVILTTLGVGIPAGKQSLPAGVDAERAVQRAADAVEARQGPEDGA